MSEMSDFGDKNVHKFAPIVPIFTHKSRVDFRQQEYIGRLKSTLLTDYIIIDNKVFYIYN